MALFRCGSGRSEADYNNVLAQVIQETASGSVASILDGANNLPLLSAIAHITAQQAGSGDPSPSNPRAISGWTGCNFRHSKIAQFWNGSGNVVVNGVTMEYLGGGKYHIYGTMTERQYTNLTINCDLFTIYDGNDSYIDFNNSFADANLGVTFLLSGTNVEQWSLSTMNRESAYSGMRGKQTNQIRVNLPITFFGVNIDFTFQPIIYGNTSRTDYQVSWQTEAGTIYGGTLDLITGELSITFLRVNMGSLNWIYQPDTYNRLYCADLQSVIKPPAAISKVSEALCTEYKTISQSVFPQNDKVIAVLSGGAIVVRNTDYSESQPYKDAMNGVYFVYPLATPLTYQLTPVQIRTLLGANNFWTDTGDSEVEYYANGDLYVQQHPVSRTLNLNKSSEPEEEKKEEIDEKKIEEDINDGTENQR